MLLGVGAGGTRGGVAWLKHVVWNSQKTSKKRTLLFLIIFSVLFSITHEYWTCLGVPTSTDMTLWLTYYSGTLRTQSCSCCVLPAWDNYLLPVFHFMSFFFLSSCYDYLRTLSFVVIFLLINFPAFDNTGRNRCFLFSQSLEEKFENEFLCQSRDGKTGDPGPLFLVKLGSVSLPVL